MKTAVLVSNAGQVIPDSHLLQVLKDLKPECLGIAAAAFGEKEEALIALEHIPELKDLGNTPEEIVKALKEYQDTLKECCSVFVLSDDAGVVTTGADNALETFDMQPYVLIEDGGIIQAVAILHGDFKKYAKGNSKHPAEFFAVQEEITPKIKMIYDLVEGDVEKLTKALAGNSSVSKDFQKLIEGESGLVSVFFKNGHMFTVNKSETSMVEQPFGWSTYLPEKQEQASSKKSGILGKTLGFGKKAIASTEPIKQEPKKDDPPFEPDKKVEVEQPKTDTAPIKNVAKYKAPAHLTTKNQIRDAYMKHAGYVPDGYKHRPEVEVRFPVADNKDLKELGKMMNGKNKPTDPIIPAELRDEIKKDDFVVKIIGNDSRKIPTLEELNKIEERHSNFYEQLGIKIDEAALCDLTFDEIKNFTAKYPAAADVLIQTLVWSLTRRIIASGGTVKTEKKETAETSGTASNPNAGKHKISFGKKMAVG